MNPSVKVASIAPVHLLKSNKDEMADYGYEDAAPDVASKTVESYGYEDAAPDVAKVAKKKKEKVNADTELSLENAKPKKSKKPKQLKGLFHSFSAKKDPRTGRTPRRSSMKQEGKPRRSSIGYQGEIEVRLPGQARPVRRRRSISFDDDNALVEIEPVTEMNPDRKELWFQDEEYAVMANKAHMMSEFVMMGGEEMAKKRNIETRGLEKLYDYANVEETQQLAYRSVFLEQGFQREEGAFNEEVVSCLYKVASMQSQAQAIARANADAEDIEEYTRETRRRIRRMSC